MSDVNHTLTKTKGYKAAILSIQDIFSDDLNFKVGKRINAVMKILNNKEKMKNISLKKNEMINDVRNVIKCEKLKEKFDFMKKYKDIKLEVEKDDCGCGEDKNHNGEDLDFEW